MQDPAESGVNRPGVSARESRRHFPLLHGQHDMGGVLRGEVLGAPITQGSCINVGEKVFAAAEEHRRDREMH